MRRRRRWRRWRPGSRCASVGGPTTRRSPPGHRRGSRLDRPAQERLEAALDESVRCALELGGTITGEHGVGQYKLRWLPWEQTEELRTLQRRIKEVFDPLGILNPGKAIVS